MALYDTTWHDFSDAHKVQSCTPSSCFIISPRAHAYSAILEELAKNGESVITEEQALQLAKQMGAHKYMKCSARTMKGLT